LPTFKVPGHAPARHRPGRIKSIRHPVKVSERSGGVQHTIANFNMYVRLPHHFKGTHMSRFVEILTRMSARSRSTPSSACSAR